MRVGSARKLVNRRLVSTAMRTFARHKRTDTPHLPKVVSLFCGAGGLDLGFYREGFEIPLAIDLSEAAIRTHKRNFAGSKGIAANLIELGPEGVLKQVKAVLGKRKELASSAARPVRVFLELIPERRQTIHAINYRFSI